MPPSLQRFSCPILDVYRCFHSIFLLTFFIPLASDFVCMLGLSRFCVVLRFLYIFITKSHFILFRYKIYLLHVIFFLAEEDRKSKREPETESSPNTSVDEIKDAKDGQGTSLKRAYSLSDLNKPNVPRRILPAPPSNGNNSET